MLFKNGKACIEDRRMDEHTILLEGSGVFAKNKFIHYDFKDMTHWINKMNWYATREMQDYIEFATQSHEIKIGNKNDKDIKVFGGIGKNLLFSF